MYQPIISFESVKRQNDDFFNDLTTAVKRFRDAGNLTTEAIKKSHIMQVIAQHTGLNIIMYLDRGVNMGIYTPYITPRHVFHRDGGSLTKMLDVKKIGLNGTVDPENVKVTGVFSEVASELMVGVDLIRPGLMTHDEVAAVILHEVGHVFTCWQFMTTIAYGALVINQTITNVFSTDNYQTKRIYIKEAEEVLGLEGDQSIEDLVDTSKENVEVILNTRFVRSLRQRTTSAYYDYRNCEQLADTFVARHGGGAALARGLHKLDKAFGSYGNSNLFVHMATQTAALIKVIKPFSGISLSDILYTLDQPNRYDDPKDRLAFIKFQLIDDLKQIPAGNKELRSGMLGSIADIDNILNNITARKSVFKAIHETFTSHGRATSKSQAAIKQLEGMLYNELFLQSAKLKNLN